MLWLAVHCPNPSCSQHWTMWTRRLLPRLAKMWEVTSNTGGPQVGATSGKTLDEIIRHAHVLGFNQFTRSDALAAAEYKDELRLYKCVLSPHSRNCQALAVVAPGWIAFVALRFLTVSGLSLRLPNLQTFAPRLNMCLCRQGCTARRQRPEDGSLVGRMTAGVLATVRYGGDSRTTFPS